MTAINHSLLTITAAKGEVLPANMRPFTRVPPPAQPTRPGHFIFRMYPRAGLRALTDDTGQIWWKPAIWLTPEVLFSAPGLHEWTQDHREAFVEAQKTIATCRNRWRDPAGNALAAAPCFDY